MQDLASLSDESLVHLAQRRGPVDDRPFTLLYERHQGMVWSVCYRYLGNAQDAEDVMQEVFVRAHRGLKGFEGRSSFRTWLYQIAANLCHNEFRRQQRSPATIGQPLEDLELSDPSVDPGSEPGRFRGDIMDAISALAEADKEILLLREFEGLSYEEIAHQLNLQLSATKMRLRRARLALRQAARPVESDNDE